MAKAQFAESERQTLHGHSENRLFQPGPWVRPFLPRGDCLRHKQHLSCQPPCCENRIRSSFPWSQITVRAPKNRKITIDRKSSARKNSAPELEHRDIELAKASRVSN